MQGKKKKGLLTELQNASTMLILIVFIVLCLIIAIIIGIHAAKKRGMALSETNVSEEQTGDDAAEAGESEMDESKSAAETTSMKETITEETTESMIKETNKSTTEETTAKASSENSSDEEQSSAAGEMIFEDCGDGGVLVSMVHTGGWGDEEDPFVQYEIVVNNTTDEDINGWIISLQVSEDADCSNIWNGSAEIKDGVLTITPADFNDVLVAGTQTSVGLIVEKPEDVKFLDVTFQQGD
jgi:hypothetical protein